MIRAAIAVLLAATFATPAAAQDFAAGSEAKPWGLYAEAPARFTATVSDALCAVTGDCPADCGAGRRQMVLMREADGVLVFPMKNAQPVFSGAASELLPFCGQRVEVDGLLITDPDLGAENVYLVQRIRAEGAAEWTAANQWTKDWQAANPGATGKGPWFRRDPRINAAIDATGYFGLGLDQDAAILKGLAE
ncbi:MAG: hypothetical protein CVT84_01010 [Alphaproteobacteria bacterium HGW-Alphaproteobacteria-6]|nr:MAG: hypothetical protein CVT84_01010 [Alphaproteobacteria bacterium HGW-Alphaproteobacteria-6]